MRRILFFLVGGLIILGQFGRVELPGVGALYFHDVVIILLTLLSAWTYRSKILSIAKRSKAFHIVSLFSIWVMLTSLISFHANFTAIAVALLYLCRFVIYLCFGAIIRQMSIDDEINPSELRGWLVAVTSGILSLGFIQYLYFPDTRGLALLGWDDHYYRLISTIFDPGFTGILLVLGSFVLLQWTLRVRSMGFWLAYAALALGILLTYSRASYLAWIFGMVVFAWKTKTYWLGLCIPLFLGAMLILPRPGGEGVKLERTASAVARVESVSGAFEKMTPVQFFIGRGWYWKKTIQPSSMLNGIQVPNHSSAAENSYVFLLSSLGVIGLGLWAWMGYRIVASSSGDALVWSTTAAIAVHALFTNTWLYGFVILYYGVVMAYSARRSHSSSRQKQR